MILHYNHIPDNPPQGMILGDFSIHPKEEEILLFPFTFIKVNSLNKINETSYELDCNILNKECVLEFELKKDKNVDIEKDILIIK